MGKVETVQERIVAILHYVVEDTPWTLAQLQAEGFSKEIIVAVDCLTKRPRESYRARVARAAGNPLARRVKAADLEDNMDLRRYPRVSAADRTRLAKYLAAWKTVTAAGR
jgi:(p)ppGpp synthase/HD superfamily hydrolase